jgi:C4-dicarboxylate transporter, DctM subunit
MQQALFVVLPVALLLLGFPIFLILLTTALIIRLATTSMPPGVIQTVMFGSLGSFPLVAIPFFILAGEIMGQGGIAKRIVAWVLSLVGGVQGSLALATIASSELFGAMSGSAVGCVAAVGRLLLPALKENGYGDRFSISLVTCSGAIAIIIPPSIAMIIYAVTAQQSLTVLFTAGILPAILIGAMEAVFVLAYARVRMVPITSKTRGATFSLPPRTRRGRSGQSSSSSAASTGEFSRPPRRRASQSSTRSSSPSSSIARSPGRTSGASS